MKLMTRKPAEPPAEPDLDKVIASFQSDTQEIESEAEPPILRAMVWLLAGLVISAIAWASFAYLDRVVTATGQIQTTVPTVMVQPLETAIVKELMADVGQVVKAGQVLARLDPTFVQADVEQLRAQLANLNAQVLRLEAERDDRVLPEPPAQTSSPEQILQYGIWLERRAQYRAQMQTYEEKISATLAQIRSREEEQAALRERMKVMAEIETMRNKLVVSETGSRLNLLIATDNRIEVGRNLSVVVNGLQEAQHTLNGQRFERDVYQRDWRNRALAELVTARNDQASTAEQLVKARKRGDLVTMEAPVDSIVLERAPRSIGSVIQEAEPFFTLVPLNAPLEVEVKVDARDIGYIQVGDPVHIKLDAYTYLEHGMLEGEVRTISEDAFQNDKAANSGQATGPAFYKARVTITKNTLRNIPDHFRLIPGLTLTAEIKIGSRSVMSYLLRPIMRGLGEAMREP